MLNTIGEEGNENHLIESASLEKLKAMSLASATLEMEYAMQSVSKSWWKAIMFLLICTIKVLNIKYILCNQATSIIWN